MTVSTKIGFGKRVVGEIVVLGKSGRGVESHQVDARLSGKIILFLSYVPVEVMEKVGLVGVKGVIVPGMHWRDFERFRQAEDFTLLMLSKFGKLDATAELAEKLEKLDGKEGKLDGEGKTLNA